MILTCRTIPSWVPQMTRSEVISLAYGDATIDLALSRPNLSHRYKANAQNSTRFTKVGFIHIGVRSANLRPN